MLCQGNADADTNTVRSIAADEMAMEPHAMRRDKTVDGRFDSLYRAHHAEVLAYFVRRIPPADAEDAAAEVFAVAWRRLDQIPEGDRAIRWLFGVAHNVLTNHRRSWRRALQLNRRLSGLGQPEPETPESQIVRSAEDRLLLDALGQLRWSDQEILRLATWEKLSHEAIGELLGLAEAAVSQRISRARKRLIKVLEGGQKREHGHD